MSQGSKGRRSGKKGITGGNVFARDFPIDNLSFMEYRAQSVIIPAGEVTLQKTRIFPLVPCPY
jgi:hypothetical protein